MLSALEDLSPIAAAAVAAVREKRSCLRPGMAAGGGEELEARTWKRRRGRVWKRGEKVEVEAICVFCGGSCGSWDGM